MDSKKHNINYIHNDSYDEYKKNQINSNKLKINNVWVREENIIDIKKYCTENNITPKKILCHGTRNGTELVFFNKHFPNTFQIGSEISDTALNYPNTIQWDFHNINEDWINQFDIVYTNSWDHSYDLILATNVWLNQLSDNGILILEWSNFSFKKAFNKIDCCGCDLETLVGILKEFGKVNYFETKGINDEKSYLVICHKKKLKF